jgi:oligogalacturonide lyase
MLLLPAPSQTGKPFPSERKEIKDTVTGTMLAFLTSTQNGDARIYQTHNQWASDGSGLYSGAIGLKHQIINQ